MVCDDYKLATQWWITNNAIQWWIARNGQAPMKAAELSRDAYQRAGHERCKERNRKRRSVGFALDCDCQHRPPTQVYDDANRPKEDK